MIGILLELELLDVVEAISQINLGGNPSTFRYEGQLVKTRGIGRFGIVFSVFYALPVVLTSWRRARVRWKADNLRMRF